MGAHLQCPNGSGGKLPVVSLLVPRGLHRQRIGAEECGRRKPPPGDRDCRSQTLRTCRLATARLTLSPWPSILRPTCRASPRVSNTVKCACDLCDLGWALEPWRRCCVHATPNCRYAERSEVTLVVTSEL